MTELRKAAERALDALEDIFGKEKKDVGAINALRQALADAQMARLWEQKQEPVAWITRRTGDGGVYVDGYETCESTDYGAIPVYTAPPKKEWVGLTHEERFLNDCRTPEEIECAIAIEQALKEKNG